MKILLLLLNIIITYSLKVCVIGASSSLGREIIFQGINDLNYNILGITNSPEKVCIPYRGSGLDDKSDKILIKDKKLKLYNYLDKIPNYDALIFTIGGTAFEKNDYSDKITEKFLNNLPKTCKSVTLISAFGVGDSIKRANLGIISMRNWYLKDVYRAKENQEILLNNFERNIKKNIYRPKVLSYGDTSFDSIPRQVLAKEILNNI